MGVFGPPKEFRERTFTMPCSPSEAMSVIAAATDVDDARPFGSLIDNYVAAQQQGEPVGQPPLEETIYLEHLSDSGMIIAAGNRVKTKWRMQLALSGSNPVSGSFGAIEVNTQQWFGNILNMNIALRNAVRRVGGKTQKWPGQF